MRHFLERIVAEACGHLAFLEKMDLWMARHQHHQQVPEDVVGTTLVAVATNNHEEESNAVQSNIDGRNVRVAEVINSATIHQTRMEANDTEDTAEETRNGVIKTEANNTFEAGVDVIAVKRNNAALKVVIDNNVSSVSVVDA